MNAKACVCSAVRLPWVTRPKIHGLGWSAFEWHFFLLQLKMLGYGLILEKCSVYDKHEDKHLGTGVR